MDAPSGGPGEPLKRMAQHFYIGDHPRAAVPTEEVDCGAELAGGSFSRRRAPPQEAKLSDEPLGSQVEQTDEAPPDVEEADKAGGDPHVSEPTADKREALPFSPRQVQAATDPGGEPMGPKRLRPRRHRASRGRPSTKRSTLTIASPGSRRPR